MSVHDEMQADYDEAMQALADDEMDLARQCLRRMMKRDPDDYRVVELSGDFARLRGEYDKADKLYQRMPQLSSDKSVLALSLVSRGVLYAEQDRRDEASELFRQCIPLFRELNDTQRLINACGNLGDTLMESGHLQESADAYQQALDTALAEAEANPDNKDENEFLLAVLERDLGQAFRMLGEIDQAVQCFERALNRFDLLEEELEVAQTLDCLSVVRQIEGRYEEAEALLNQAIEINAEHDNEDGLSVNYGNLAFLHKHRKNFEEAEVYLNKAFAIDKACGRADAIADYHIQLGEVLYERGKYSEAEANLMKAMKLHKDDDNVLGIAAAHSHLGVLYRHRKEYEQSEKMSMKALQMAESIQHLDFVAGILDELATLRKLQGRPDEARAFWARSLSYFERLKSSKMTDEIKQQLAEL